MTVVGMVRAIAASLLLAAGSAAACPPPAVAVPPDVPVPGCPRVTGGRCTAHCAPSMTYLDVDYGTDLATLGGLWAMTAALAQRGWTIDLSATRTPRVVVLARHGHDRMTLVAAVDRPVRIEITFAPG